MKLRATIFLTLQPGPLLREWLLREMPDNIRVCLKKDVGIMMFKLEWIICDHDL